MSSSGKGKGLTPYSAKSDKTLTTSQRKSGAFRSDVVDKVAKRQSAAKGSFRFQSNQTLAGHKSGYHEAFVVTDHVDKLAGRSAPAKGLAKMPKATKGIWKDFSGKPIVEKNVRAALEAGDGARTDTARTILAAPKGDVAGHTGSGVHTKHQSHAHDLLRAQSMRVLSDPKLTPRAIGVIGAATTVYSMAPGKFASSAKNASKLKSTGARKTWEEDRNTAKRHLSSVYGQLPPPEKKAVRKHMETFAKEVGDKRRRLAPNEPSSPLRETGGSSKAAIRGGDYFSKSKAKAAAKVKPTMTLPAKSGPREITLFVSRPFRDPRTKK